MSALLHAIEIETGAAPTRAVIWLHGLGADGGDFAPVIPYLGLAAAPGVRFVFPHAPAMPVTCNGGYVMPAWYDITHFDGIDRAVDEGGIEASCAAVRALIARENERGIATGNIVLAGFSQGGAMAYTAGLIHPHPLAGIIALSAYIPAPRLLAPASLGPNRNTPVFAGHGSDDDVVPLPLGQRAVDRLRQDGYGVDWHTYDIPHSVCEEELADIGRWLNARFA